MDCPRSSSAMPVAVGLQVSVPSNHACQVAAAILPTSPDPRRGATEPQEAVVGRQVRALNGAAHLTGDVLPTAAGQEPVVATRDDLGTVGQPDPKRGLHG